MGFTDYSNPDDKNGTSGAGGPGGHSPGPVPGPRAGTLDDVKDMLIDYNERFKNASPTLFRDGILTQAISVLIGKDKPNPLLVGSAGVGKTRIVEDIARRIENNDPLVPAQLRGHTVYELPLSNLVAGAGLVGELETRLAMLVDFATSPRTKAILFVDEVHLLQDAKNPVYRTVAQILKPALARGSMRLIGATTLQESRSFGNDPAFQRRFTRLIVDELDRAQTFEVLKSARGSYVQHYGSRVTVSDTVLEQLVVIADESSRADAHRPDSALTLLDRSFADSVVSHSAAIARAAAAGDTATVQALQAVTVLHLNEKKLRSVALRLATGMAAKTPFDRAEMTTALARLKGQDVITGELVDALVRENLGVFPRRRPTAWMLAGPSGTGKTEAAKIVSQHLTGQPPIILNMGEYTTAHEASKLIGSGPGYLGSDSDQEMPFDSLESNPYRVILLDEAEKAHQSIHQLFLTALDDGWMRMASGKIIDFSKATIIATTNAAQESVSKKALGFKPNGHGPEDVLTRQQLVRALQGVFAPEFLGRFSQLVAFAAIDKDTYTQILLASYERERLRICTDNPRMGAKVPTGIDPGVLKDIVTATFLADQGARPAQGAARTLIEDSLMPGPASTSTALAPAVPDHQDDNAPDPGGDLTPSRTGVPGTHP